MLIPVYEEGCIRNSESLFTSVIENYKEQDSAQSTSRLLDGSYDHGYYVEYVGYGYLTVDKIKYWVKAVYLFEEEEYKEAMEMYDGDEGSLDWENALKRFEICE